MNIIELFNQIYEKYYKSIVSYFSRRFDSDEAEDLAQITFMKLWGYLPALGYIKKEKSKLFGKINLKKTNGLSSRLFDHIYLHDLI